MISQRGCDLERYQRPVKQAASFSQLVSQDHFGRA